jgi:hypothetical protein
VALALLVTLVVTSGCLAGSGKPLATAKAFHAAARKGDREAVAALIHHDILRGMERPPLDPDFYSFVRVDTSGPWDLILWRNTGKTVVSVSKPQFSLVSSGSNEARTAPELEATVRAVFTVEAKETAGSAPVRYDFLEEYALVYVQPGAEGGEGWRVVGYTRTGVPYQEQGGTAPGSPLAVVAGPDDRLTCGPFSWLDPWAHAWDPGGTRFALLGENFTHGELWVIDTTSGTGSCVGEGLSRQARLLGWSGDGTRVLFCEEGQKATGQGGPGQAAVGWWIRSVPVSGGPPSDVCFIPLDPPYAFARLTSDGSTLIYHRSGYVRKVDLATGTVTLLATDADDRGEGGEGVHFAPDGWAAVWETSTEPGKLAAHAVDFRAGTTADITSPAEWAALGGETPDGQIVVVEALKVEASPIPGNLWVGAIRAISFRDWTGAEEARLEPPGGEARIGSYAVSPDGAAVVFTCGPVETVTVTDPPRGYVGPAPVVRARELWVWEKATRAASKLADLPPGAAYVQWPVPSLVRVALRDEGAGVDDSLDYDLSRVNGGWRADERVWSGKSSTVIGQSGGALITVQGLPDQPGCVRIQAEGPDGSRVLAEGRLTWHEIERGYLVVVEIVGGAAESFILIPLP